MGSRVPGLSSYSTQTWLLHVRWDLPGSGIKPVSPVLQGRLLTTGPPGKSSHIVNICFLKNFSVYPFSSYLFRCFVLHIAGSIPTLFVYGFCIFPLNLDIYISIFTLILVVKYIHQYIHIYMHICVYMSHTYTHIHIYTCIYLLFSCSVVSDSATPWTAAHQASLSISNSWSLLKLLSIESVMPSNHLILCCRLLLLPSIFPSIGVFSNEPDLHIRWPKYQSFSFSISPSNEHSGLISFWIDWFDLLAVQRTLKESSPTLQFKSINS